MIFFTREFREEDLIHLAFPRLTNAFLESVSLREAVADLRNRNAFLFQSQYQHFF